MPYKISGTVSDPSVIYVTNHGQLHNLGKVEVVNDPGPYIIRGLDYLAKRVTSVRNSDGKSISYGNVEPWYYATGLWAWGNNDMGQLGQEDHIESRESPVQIGLSTNWNYISCGSYHVVVIKDDGTLWAWGSNGNGRLGLGHTFNRSSPNQVGSETNWVSVVGGYDHTLAINSSDQLFVWGGNTYGQLGQGDCTSRTSPVKLDDETNWVSAAGGSSHTLAINSSGQLFAFGRNDSGQLGLRDILHRSSPTQVENIGSGWEKISAGDYHSIGIVAE